MSAEIAALFPGEFIDSELEAIPMGWKIGIIDEVFNLIMGQSPPGETYNEIGEGIAFYQGRTDFGSRFPKPRIYCTAPTRFANPGDTLVSVRAPVGDINMAIEKCCIGRVLHPFDIRAAASLTRIMPCTFCEMISMYLKAKGLCLVQSVVRDSAISKLLFHRLK